MNRSQSEDHIAFGPETPWERSTFNRLPPRGESEPSVSTSHRSRMARSNSVNGPRQASRSATQRSDGSRYRGTPPPEDSVRKHHVQGSFSAQGTPRPYETSFYMPPAVQSAASPPPPYTRALAGTPPESLDDKSLTSTEKSVSPSTKQVTNVLPGTMSARTTRSKPSARQRSERGKTKPGKSGSWKIIFKQMFTKNPVDETQFEKIQDKHWTDD